MSLFQPARLVKGKNRWYIVYYQVNPDTMERERFRVTHQMNRIENRREREQFAKLAIREINRKLPYGYPFEQDHRTKQERTPAIEALEVIKQLKIKTLRKDSGRSYKSKINILQGFLRSRGLREMYICEFTDSLAVEFMDHLLINREIGPVTYNTYVNYLSTVFNDLVKRNYLKKNPFSSIDKKKEGSKKRRPFSNEEKVVVFSALLDESPLLAIAASILYHCAIRPKEMRMMKRRYISLEKGYIFLPGDITKNHEDSYITIPNDLMLLLENLLPKMPDHYYIFGENFQPHPKNSCGVNTMNYKHTKVLAKLEEKGLISDTDGLVFYSWKDTGAIDMSDEKMPLDLIRNHLRHKSLDYTSRYLSRLPSKVVPSIKEWSTFVKGVMDNI